MKGFEETKMSLRKDYDENTNHSEFNYDEDMEDTSHKREVRRMLEDKLERKRLRQELEDDLDDEFNWDDLNN